jgi:hypothetical protein
MPANRLTKIFVRQKHVKFLRQLSLKDVKEYLPNAGPESPDLESPDLESPDPESLTHWY